MSWKLQKAINYLGLGVGLLFANGAQAEYPLFVQVKAYMQCYGGNYVYHYKVINNQAHVAVSSFSVGRTNDRWDEHPDLTVAPVVVNEKYNITAPAGWRGGGGGWEQFPDYLSIEWGVADADAHLMAGIADDASFIAPGKTVTGFSVTLPQPDPAYLNGHFTVGLDYGSSYTGMIEFDPSEPSLCP